LRHGHLTHVNDPGARLGTLGRMKPLPLERLRRRCDPERLPFFATTAEVEAARETLGQARALEAIELGIGMRRDGYNLFAMGPEGLGRHTPGAQPPGSAGRGPAHALGLVLRLQLWARSSRISRSSRAARCTARTAATSCSTR
jgi:AAA domain